MQPRLLKSFEDLILITRPSKIVELGSWKGQSAVGLLTYAKAHGFQAEILCVDTWLGSLEHWSNRFPNSEFNFESLGLHEGEPSILAEFKSFIAEWKFDSQVSILRCPSKFAENYLSSHWSETDLIYVDADHSTLAVLNDLEICSRSMRHGVLSGDDFSWKSVRLALLIFVLKHALKLEIFVSDNMNTWVLLDPKSEQINRFLLHGWKRKRILQIVVVSFAEWIGNRLRERSLTSTARRSRGSLKT